MSKMTLPKPNDYGAYVADFKPPHRHLLIRFYRVRYFQ